MDTGKTGSVITQGVLWGKYVVGISGRDVSDLGIDDNTLEYLGSRSVNLRYRKSIDNTVKRNRGTYKPIESIDV